MNSTPPASNAAFIVNKVFIFWASGTPFAASTLLIEERLTPDFPDNSSPDHLNSALAALTWSDVIIVIINILYDTISVFYES